MFGVIKALTDVRNYIKELKTYFGLKNQTLFTGTWTTGTKTITNISKYQIVKVYTWEVYNAVLLERVSNTRIRGEGMVQGISSIPVHTSVGINLMCDSDQVTLQLSEYMHHSANSSHGGAATIGIVKIVGVEPIIPDALAEYIRGGYCVKLGGGLHVVIKAMLDGYRQFCKKHQGYSFCKAKQEVDEDRGKLGHYILRCEQVQRTAVNNGIRGSLHQNAYSCGDIIDQCENAVCRNVQFRNLRKYEHDIRCGIKTAYRIYGHTYSLRQITPRGCCCA